LLLRIVAEVQDLQAGQAIEQIPWQARQSVVVEVQDLQVGQAIEQIPWQARQIVATEVQRIVAAEFQPAQIAQVGKVARLQGRERLIP